MPSYLEFFAGGGMVRAGLGGRWKCQFANDFDPLKVQVYADNWGEAQILEDDIHKVEAEDLGRRVDLAWASFPCQDLSTAGNGLGIGQASGANRTRSGTFWAFIDLMRGLKANGRLPRIVVLENVVGLLTINGGEEFKAVIAALGRLGMRAGAVVVDARHFVPQSRQRVFIVAVSKTAKVADELLRDEPYPAWHPDPLVKAVEKLSPQCRERWMWLNLGAAPATPIVTDVDISRLRFRYAIEGDNPPWRPVSAFDDGSKVYIEMPNGIAKGEAPPLFVIGPEGDGQLVNYRVRQNYYIVDRLFAAAELRMGGEHQQTVRISRTDGRAR